MIMKRFILMVTAVVLMTGLGNQAMAQDTSQKDFCKSVFAEGKKYDISSIYAMGMKEYFKKGEARIGIGAKAITLYDGSETETIPFERTLYSIQVKKNNDPVYCYEADFTAIAQETKGKMYVTASEVKGKTVILFFIWYKNKKTDLMKFELF